MNNEAKRERKNKLNQDRVQRKNRVRRKKVYFLTRLKLNRERERETKTKLLPSLACEKARRRSFTGFFTIGYASNV